MGRSVDVYPTNVMSPWIRGGKPAVKYVSQIDANKPRAESRRADADGQRARENVGGREGGKQRLMPREGEKEGGGGEGRKKRDANVMRGRPVSCCSSDQANGAASKNTNLQIVNTQPQLFNKCNEARLCLPLLRYQLENSVKRKTFCEHRIIGML